MSWKKELAASRDADLYVPKADPLAVLREIRDAAAELDSLSHCDHEGWTPATDPSDVANWREAWERFRRAIAQPGREARP